MLAVRARHSLAGGLHDDDDGVRFRNKVIQVQFGWVRQQGGRTHSKAEREADRGRRASLLIGCFTDVRDPPIFTKSAEER